MLTLLHIVIVLLCFKVARLENKVFPSLGDSYGVREETCDLTLFYFPVLDCSIISNIVPSPLAMS